jgi:hypothetical protein
MAESALRSVSPSIDALPGAFPKISPSGLCIEADRPMADNLKRDTGNHCRLAAAATVKNDRQRQEPTAPISVTTSPRKTTKIRRTVVVPQAYHPSYRKPPSVCASESENQHFGNSPHESASKHLAIRI